MLFNGSFFLEKPENSRNLIAVLLHHGPDSLRQHPGNILVKAASCNMACPFHDDTRILNRFHRFYIYFCGGQQHLSQSAPQLLIISIQACSGHFKHFAHQGKSVGMHTGRRNTDKRVPRLYMFPGNQVLLVHNPHRKARKIVLLLRHQARMLRCLASQQGRPRLPASLRNSLYNGCDFLRKIPAACNIIQEKQRFSPRTGHIIHAHGHTVDSDCVMAVHKKGQLQLGTHSIRAGQQCGVLHGLKGLHGKGA